MQENTQTPQPPNKAEPDEQAAVAELDAPTQTETGWRHCLSQIQIRRALERAEQRITENFRVPPGGG